MAEPTKRKKWSAVQAQLVTFDRKALVSLLGELYDASVANRRFLHSRLTPGGRAIEEYRHRVADALYPDPFSKRRVSARPPRQRPAKRGACSQLTLLESLSEICLQISDSNHDNFQAAHTNPAVPLMISLTWHYAAVSNCCGFRPEHPATL